MAKRSRQASLPGFDDVQDPATEDAVDAPSTAPKTEHRAGTVYAVDAYSLIFQVFHALPDMTSPSGQPVAAIHGFTRDIVDLLENKRPDYLFCAFDAPGPTFRNERYEQYKANREEIPADLQLQIPQIRRMMDAMNVPVLQREGYEADDVLATLAKACRQQGLRCVIVTSDKDCRQLISDQVSLFNIRKSQEYDAATLHADWGIRPDQVVDFQALVGDSIDNVPGIALIGPKIARELLEKYRTLEGVLDHAPEVSGKKRRENLMQGRETALLSRDLVRLVDDVPLDIDWDAGRVGPIDPERIGDLCREFGFRGIAKRLGVQDEEASVESTRADYRTIATWDELAQLTEQLSGQPRIAVDTETTSTNPRWAEIVGYSFAWQAGRACYVPVRAPVGEPQLDAQRVRDMLLPILEDPGIGKIGQNLKYDTVVLRAAGIRLRGTWFDTMVADYLLDPGERNHGIDELAKRYLGYVKIKTQDVIGTGKKQKRMDEVPVALVAPYACEDADIALRLAERLESELQQQGLMDLFRNLEMPLIDVLAEMEFNGIRVDAERLAELGARFGERMLELKQEIYSLAGEEFNIDSRQQLAKVLFENLDLPVVKRTKTGPSTDVSVLTELAGQHALPAKIIEYRQYAKLKSTYVDSLRDLVHPLTGRVHTSFKQDVAATGRLSSTDPNLQNIPVRTEDGRAIRSAFLAGQADWKLLAADYSQIELRVLAHFCGDPTLQNAFATDQDIHALVASEVHGVPLDEVTPEMRRRAKAVNFGVIYGQSAFGLAKSLRIDTEQAAAFIEAYFARYSRVDDFVMKTLAECRKNGYVSTILGRRRTVEGVREPSSQSDSRQRNLPERIAINTVIQGSAADLIKKAMINVCRRMQREVLQARMLLQIHDELVFEVPSNEVHDVATLVTDEMANVQRLAVPLKVDVKVGSNWADCEAWE